MVSNRKKNKNKKLVLSNAIVQYTGTLPIKLGSNLEKIDSGLKNSFTNGFTAEKCFSVSFPCRNLFDVLSFIINSKSVTYNNLRNRKNKCYDKLK